MVLSSSYAHLTIEQLPADRMQLLHGVQILIVDDDPDSVDLAATLLNSYGAKTITANSAIEALVQWEQHQPHLLISDLAMPEKDGYWLLSEIKRKAQPSTEVLAIAWSACVTPQTREQALSLGYHRFVQKPSDLQNLVSTIASLVGRLSSE